MSYSVLSDYEFKQTPLLLNCLTHVEQINFFKLKNIGCCQLMPFTSVHSLIYVNQIHFFFFGWAISHCEIAINFQGLVSFYQACKGLQLVMLPTKPMSCCQILTISKKFKLKPKPYTHNNCIPRKYFISYINLIL